MPIVAVTVNIFSAQCNVRFSFPGIQRLRVRDLSSPSVNAVGSQRTTNTPSFFANDRTRNEIHVFFDFVDLYFFFIFFLTKEEVDIVVVREKGKEETSR